MLLAEIIEPTFPLDLSTQTVTQTFCREKDPTQSIRLMVCCPTHTTIVRLSVAYTIVLYGVVIH